MWNWTAAPAAPRTHGASDPAAGSATTYTAHEPDMTPELTLRTGLRGYNREGRNQYYLFGSLWHTLSGHDELQFANSATLENDRGATWTEIGGGLVLLEREAGSAYLNLSYQYSVDDLDWNGGSANLGFNWAW